VAENIFVDLIATQPGPGKISVYLDATLAFVTALPAGDGLATITLVPTKDAVTARDREDLADLGSSSSSSSLSSSSKKTSVRGIATSIESPLTVSASIFIDATYEGDLLALADLQYAIGRESNITYGESFAGVLFEPSPYGAHQFNQMVDPYKEGQSMPITLVQDGPAGESFF
jgi:FAD dependent oxidoreductase